MEPTLSYRLFAARFAPARLFAVAAAAMAAFVACQAASEMEAAIRLPTMPSAWAGFGGAPGAGLWELSWLSASGSGGPFPAAPGAVVALRLPRGEEAAVFCRAALGAARSLPYGAAWPQALDASGELAPTAAGGFAAEAAACLYRLGLRHCGLDLVRLAAEAEARMADPWDADPSAIATAALGGRLRADHLREPERVGLTVTVLPGPARPDSPYGLVIEPGPGGSATVSVPIGRVRRWIGDGYELVVAVSPSGEPAWTLSTSTASRLIEVDTAT
ncbi:MAG TPA: hypothetical protein PLW80_11835, partial [Spirochaetales bacterium]|nr:hypothetical protein [Spirochaetales bacterium]